jgi:hypothetical protein
MADDTAVTNDPHDSGLPLAFSRQPFFNYVSGCIRLQRGGKLGELYIRHPQ